MTNRKGLLKHSPLIYVVASLRFAPWPLLAKKIDEIHDDLRETFPLINRIQTQQLDQHNQVVTQRDGSSAWILKTSDLSYGVQFATDQVLILCKQYERYKTLETHLKLVLDTLFKHMRFVDVVNMGVRYVDSIAVKEGEELERYVNKGLLPPDIDGLEKQGGSVGGFYKSQDTDLRVRCRDQLGALSVPEDLVPLLAITKESNEPLRLETLKAGEMLLDLDSVKIFKAPQRMLQNEIITQLNSLHKEANTFFRHESVFTDHAFNVWKGDI